MNPLPRLPMDARWARLQTELRDLAFVLERRGSHAAADLACMIAARIDELHAVDFQETAWNAEAGTGGGP